MNRKPLALLVVMIVVWMLLSDEFSIGQLLLGGALSVLLLLGVAELRPVRPRLRNLHLVPPLLARVALDVLHSNLRVARIILGLARRRDIHSAFLEIPLDMRDPHGLAMLVAILTATPGTVWAGVSEDKATLTVHVLDLADEAESVRSIKERYERPLMRIFG